MNLNPELKHNFLMLAHDTIPINTSRDELTFILELIQEINLEVPATADEPEYQELKANIEACLEEWKALHTEFWAK